MRIATFFLFAGSLTLAAGAHSSPNATPVADSSYQELHWRMIGPFRGGRTRAVTGVPGQAGTFLIGAVNGGVWKTDDFGRTWTPIFDAQPTQSIGAIAVAPSDARVMYVGSGEGLHRPDLSVGNGVYRSTDAGVTWTHAGLDDAQQIPDLAIDPRDPNRLYAAVLGHPFGPSAERGVFRSIDGGAHWQKVLYQDENTGSASVKIDPHNPDIVYASLWNVRSGPWEDNNVYNGTRGGLFKSTDGGEHWRALKKGLPDDLVQIDVAVAPSRKDRLYATVATGAKGDYGSSAGLGVYRSDDAGESWARITTDPRPALRIGGGDLAIIKVDPSNADVLYSASIVTMKSVDGGITWASLRGAPGGDDYQNLWISPDDSRTIALVADQGAIVTTNGGKTWSSWLNQPTAQLYHVGITNNYPYQVCSGQQDSGSLCIASRGNDGQITTRDWHPVGVIEYGYAVPDPIDPDIVYGSGRSEVTRTQLSTGQVQNVTPIPLKEDGARVNRTMPLFFSPQNPHRMYYAANRLYETTDAGQNWRVVSPDLTREAPGAPPSVGALKNPKADAQRGVIYAASASPLQEGLIWVGTDDGLLWVTTNAGKDWTNVTPPDLGPWSKVTQLDASHFDPKVAFASVSRLRVDDPRPYLLRTRDGGRSWQPITNGLSADAAANTVREDTERRGLLYAGTEKAVWVSFDEGDHWQSLQMNLPHTSMRDLVVHGQDLVLATHGRGFWILDDISPLRQASATPPAGDAALLKPTAAIRVQRSTWSDTPIPPDEPTARNPPAGAVIDYWLARDTKDTVTLEILDATGTLVRRVSSIDAPRFSAEELQHQLIPPYWVRNTQPLATQAGMHRWVWDLHYAAPRAPQKGFPISAVPGDTPPEPVGPLATPGTYRARLRVGAHTWEESLTVRPDPRLKTTTEAYAAQFALATRLATALDASSGALLEGRSLRAQVKELSARGPSAATSRLQGFDETLANLLETQGNGTTARRGIETLAGDLNTLYGQVIRSDAAPTTAQSAASERAITEWTSLDAQWAALRRHDVAAVNASLRRARLPVLRPELAPAKDLDLADEE